ncbi:AAA family ATPase [Candidatus Poribacteria bacterium]|nr:AAA family ATPase [Candidatus Poribacteria bacterium]
MQNYYIESFKVTKLWGYRNINLTFNKDVNIIIGPNGSGKTTVLYLLYSILSLDLLNLLNFNFDRVEIKLKGFKESSVRTVTVKSNTEDGVWEIGIGKKKFPLNIEALFDRRLPGYYRDETGRITTRTLPPHLRRRIIPEELYDELTTLVPLVWLPVSRRLPVTENEEERYPRRVSLESVDLRLENLLEGLSRYYSILNAQLSERYREFERQVLLAILYNKDQDQLKHMLSIPSSLPTEVEKEKLVRAFKAAGLLDRKMQGRINEHFDETKVAVKRLNSQDANDSKAEDLFMLPLISRTQAMVKYAEELETDRERIFASLRLYENTVNSFLNDKSIKVNESGRLIIESVTQSELSLRDLSSGEKQILILFTETLLQVDEPMVYIADEPELSLHVSWQRKLLDSLVKLGGQIQVIVATHSPDIVGKFLDNVIELGRIN